MEKNKIAFCLTLVCDLNSSFTLDNYDIYLFCQGLTLKSWITLNLWLSCLSLPAGNTGMGHHAQRKSYLCIN